MSQEVQCSMVHNSKKVNTAQLPISERQKCQNEKHLKNRVEGQKQATKHTDHKYKLYNSKSIPDSPYGSKWV